jgi:hypothetical protein
VWWISGILRPHYEILIVLGKTDPTAARHVQRSMILVPRDTQGVKVVRALTMMGRHNSPGGEACRPHHRWTGRGAHVAARQTDSRSLRRRSARIPHLRPGMINNYRPHWM